MTPIEAAVKAANERGLFVPEEFGYEFSAAVANDIAPIITAFLEAAAEEMETARSVGFAANDQPGSLTDMGRAAILALKEAVNG